LLECRESAAQAPSASNRQAWHWVGVTDADTRAAIAARYRQAWDQYKDQWKAAEVFAADPDRLAQQERVADSATYLAEHLHEVPVFVIPCLRGRLDDQPSACQASRWGGLLPAAWSFMLAARERAP